MKILIVGDQHFRYQLPYASALSDGRRGEWEAVKEKIKESAKDCEVVVLMGDNFNSKHNHSAVNTEFIQFLHGFGDKEVYMIAGNHERFGLETAIDFIEEMKRPNWHVYTNPTLDVFKNSDISVQFIPYMTPGSIDTINVEDATKKVMGMISPAKYCFHHHIVESTEWGAGDSSIVNEIVLPKEIEAKYELVFGGHIHQPSKVTDKVYVTGNIFTNEVGEHTKSIFKLDTDTNTIEDIPLPVRGIYKVDITSTTQSIPSTIPNNSIVKVTVLDRALQGEGVETLRKQCERFDSYVLVEQYSKKRTKIKLSEADGLDFSIDSLLKVYADVKKVPLSNLTAAMALLES